MSDLVPLDVREAAKRAFSLRDSSAAVLELDNDSLLDDPPAGGARTLSFGSAGAPARVVLRVGDLHDGPGVTLAITAEPDHVAVTGIQGEEEVASVEQTGDGRWAAGPLTHGVISVLLVSPSGRLRTSWVRI